jgi:hypothetical protein
MSHTAYELALIRREQLLREAADRRLAAESASSGATPARRQRKLPRLQWPVRESHVSPRLTTRGH